MEFKKVPVIHQTDLFHNHADPDDHWDVASQFALHHMGLIDLKGVLIDYPPRADVSGIDCGDPAIGAVNQLNYITGSFVPVAVGNELKINNDADIDKVAKMVPLNSGLNMLFKTLEEAEEPVAIHIVGSAREVAVASMMRPELFREKCKAVYLNAGSAVENVMEYNAALDPYSYSKMFKLPCPLYWMPCFHELTSISDFNIGTYGTFWKFRQEEVFPYISERMKNFFAYALGRVTDNRWLSYLKYPVNHDILDSHGRMFRNMWCTAGFLHTAGKGVTVEGEIVDIAEEGKELVCGFVPIKALCQDNGRVDWEEAPSENMFIFKVFNEEKYRSAMTKALRTIISKLP